MTTEPNAPTFKDRNRALQELVREYMVLREHNLQFKEGDDLTRLLLFSEAATVIVIIEHFVRMVLGTRATDQDTFTTCCRRLSQTVSSGCPGTISRRASGRSSPSATRREPTPTAMAHPTAANPCQVHRDTAPTRPTRVERLVRRHRATLQMNQLTLD
jgi:hypothetical protein